MFCDKCGEPVTTTSKYCPKCGHQIQSHQESIVDKQPTVKFSKLIAGIPFRPKLLILTVVVVVVVLWRITSSPSHEWVKYYSDDTSAYYYDVSSIQKNGGKVKLWYLIDVRDGSLVEQSVLDCNDRTSVTTLKYISYSEHMGRGKNSGNEIENRDGVESIFGIQPGSIMELLWKKACD